MLKNNRIHRWAPNATEGVTIPGNSQDQAGSTARRLFDSCVIAINANETLMYVSDAGNNRIQKFQLI
jgi:sugar lactone lactonase YvrE